MKKINIARLIVSIVFACILGFIISACKTGTTDASTKCKQDLTVHKTQTLHANDTGKARFFYLETAPAKSSCEAHYVFHFNWANPDSLNTQSRPPLNDLTFNFRAGGLAGLIGYFGHPQEKLIYDDHGDNKYWQIDFSVGDKNSSSDTTTYTVTATLKNGTPLKDSVSIDCQIDFSGVGK